MAEIKPEQKAELIERGEWVAFVQMRDTYRDEGDKPWEAHYKTIRHFFGEEAVPAKFGGRSVAEKVAKTKSPKNISKNFETVPSMKFEDVLKAEDAFIKKQAVELVEKRPDRTGMTQKNRLPPEKKFEYANKSDFAGKKQIGAFDVVCWVAENMALDDVGVSDCPSSTAWGMLQQCRTNPMYRFEFWKTIYPKLLPSRAQIEDGSDQGGFDGEVTHEHLRKLAEMRDNAIGEVVGE